MYGYDAFTYDYNICTEFVNIQYPYINLKKKKFPPPLSPWNIYIYIYIFQGGSGGGGIFLIDARE